jgi:hypothetical protein
LKSIFLIKIKHKNEMGLFLRSTEAQFTHSPRFQCSDLPPAAMAGQLNSFVKKVKVSPPKRPQPFRMEQENQERIQTFKKSPALRRNMKKKTQQLQLKIFYNSNH